MKPNMHSVFRRLYRTKMILSCLILVASGITLLAVDHAVSGRNDWVGLLPVGELGGILVGAGVLSVWLDAYLHREQQELDDLRLRQLLHEQAPAMRDAVLEAFAANHEDLARVATPELLDQLIANSLAMRLGDEQFASEIYTDIRDQAIRAAERWHDASLSIELSPTNVGPKGAGPFFTVEVRWEYTTTPKHAQRRFVCLSDRGEYSEIVRDKDGTSAWYINPAGGVDAASPAAFELLRFSVNGEERPIRRFARKAAQTYTASIPAEHLQAGQQVTIAYTYRTLMTQSGHMVFFDVEQPTRDLRIDFDYTDCGIAAISTLDLVPSVRPTRIERTHESLPARVIRLDFDGWIFPRSGVAFVWTLDSEVAGRRLSPRRSDAKP